VRDDENFCHVAAWEWTGDENNETRHEEQISFESVVSAFICVAHVGWAVDPP
jgi:hypothetical protein